MIKYEANSAFKSTCSFEKHSKCPPEEEGSKLHWSDCVYWKPKYYDLCVIWDTIPKVKLALGKWGYLL